MNLLAQLYSYGDGLKRKVNGLLSDPIGAASLGAARMAEDQQGLLGLMDQAGYTPGSKSVLQRPQDTQQARNALADAAMQSYGGLLGATVWHGSPHKFDKFDSSKIGTGEGNQTFGHGLYFSENPNIGHHYAENLKPNGSSNSLYKVDIPDDQIARMIDLDKMLSEQPENVRKALRTAQDSGDLPRFARAYWPKSGSDASIDGMTFYQKLASEAGGDKAASEKLKALGIPGARYLDGVSRGARQGSSNYVMFPGNENLLQILERNGQALK